MKVLFVCQTHESLGVEYLSAVLQQHGHATRLAFDPAIFEHPQLHSSALARWTDYQSVIVKEAVEFRPDLVAINVWTHNAPWAVSIARRLKQATGAPVVVGGVHVSGAPDQTMRHTEYDFGIVGEGEGPLLALVQALEGKGDFASVPNLMHRQDGVLVKNPLGPFPDYASLPWPDKEMFYRESKHFRHGYYMQTSRGCPMRCSFCTEDFLSGLSSSGNRNHKVYLRTRSVENVIGELVENKARYGFTHVMFSDDILGWDQDWFEEFAHAYKEKVNLPYWCFTYPSVVSERMVKNMVASGCFQVQMGVQSLSPKVRKEIMLRNESREQVTRAIELFRNSPISLKVDNIAGVPGQTNDDLLDMARFYSVHRPDKLGIYWLTYYPGTSIVGIAEKMGHLGEEDIERINESAEGVTRYQPLAHEDPIVPGLFAYINAVIFLPEWLNRVIVDRKLYRFWPTDRWTFSFLQFLQLLVKKPIPFWNAEARLWGKTTDYLGRIVRNKIAARFAGRGPRQEVPAPRPMIAER